MSRKPPLISVILPAFNCALFLPEAVDSILAQTLGDFELLIIYDESSDETLAIIERYALRDSRVRLIMGQKAKLVGALNQGIHAAQGKYIARMDADDVSTHLRFERQVELIENQSLDFCGCDMVIMNELGRPIDAVIMPASADLIAITLAATVPFAHGSAMMRKQFLQEHSLVYRKSATAEDYDFWCEAYSLGARFGNVNELLFHYRHLSNSLSKVHAKVVHQNTRALRRKFVRNNLSRVRDAVLRQIPLQAQLSARESSFLLLAAYLIFLEEKSTLVFKAIKTASLRSNAIAIAKILNGF
jgi:glycosyltransferase involved in cell wall biosynthesis